MSEPSKVKKNSKSLTSRKKENTDKMRDLLSRAGEVQGNILNRSMQKKLKFSNVNLKVYDRHSSLINGIFLNPNINTLVSYNEKQLHCWNPENLELISSVQLNESDSSPLAVHSIQCLCYSKKYFLYFAASNDFKLIVFNEHLNLIQVQKMPIGLAKEIYFFDQTDQLIVGGVQGVFIINLAVTFKYDPRMAIFLDPKGQSISVQIKTVEIDQQIFNKQNPMQLDEKQDAKDKQNKNKQVFFQEKLFIMSIEDDKKNKNNKLPFIPEKTLQKYGQNIKQLQGDNTWVKGLKIYEKYNLFVVWYFRTTGENQNGDNPQIYALTNFGLYSQGEIWQKKDFNIPIKQDLINDVIILKEHKFYITAHGSGDIHLWKLVEAKSIEVEDQKEPDNQKEINEDQPRNITQNCSVHIFKGHSKAVTSLAVLQQKGSSFVSASLDGKIKIWCFEKMIELYCFDLTLDSPTQNSAVADQIMKVKLISDKIYALIYHNNIEIGIISHLASSFYISSQQINYVDKCYQNHKMSLQNNVQALILSFNDNSISLLNLNDQQILTTIYPPPTNTEVIKVLYCMCIQRMILLLKSGAICVYKIFGKNDNIEEIQDMNSIQQFTKQSEFMSTGILENFIQSKQIRDYEGKGISQQITCINKNFFQELPKFDCEIFSDLYKYIEPTDPDYEFIASSTENERLDQFLVIGLSKGSIIFVKVNNFGHIYARFSIHRSAVQQVYELHSQQKLMSICEENILKFWGFEGGREIIYQKYNLQREVFQLIKLQEQLLMCFKSGDTELLSWDDDDKVLCKLPQEKNDEHEDAITCCDILLKLGLYVTADCNGLVKLWNRKKELIREVQFVESISSVSFINQEADIIVVHSKNISLLKSKDLFINYKYEVSQQDYEHFMSKKVPIDDKLFIEINQKVNKTKQINTNNMPKVLADIKNISYENIVNKYYNDKQNQQKTFDNNLIQKNKKTFDGYFQGFKSVKSNQEITTAKSILQQNQGVPIGTGGQILIQVNNNEDPHKTLSQQEQQQQELQLYDRNLQKEASEINNKKNTQKQDQQLKEDLKRFYTSNVLTQFNKNQNKFKQIQKQNYLMQNCNRRLLTELKIQSNIQATNKTADQNQFNDILTSQSVTQFNQIGKFTSPQIKTQSVAIFAAIGSKASQYSVDSKVSNLQTALQQMANSANTFNVVSNNSFKPKRVQNYKLVSDKQKAQHSNHNYQDNNIQINEMNIQSPQILSLTTSNSPFIRPNKQYNLYNTNSSLPFSNNNGAIQNLQIQKNKEVLQENNQEEQDRHTYNIDGKSTEMNENQPSRSAVPYPQKIVLNEKNNYVSSFHSKVYDSSPSNAGNSPMSMKNKLSKLNQNTDPYNFTILNQSTLKVNDQRTPLQLENESYNKYHASNQKNLKDSAIVYQDSQQEKIPEYQEIKFYKNQLQSQNGFSVTNNTQNDYEFKSRIQSIAPTKLSVNQQSILRSNDQNKNRTSQLVIDNNGIKEEEGADASDTVLKNQQQSQQSLLNENKSNKVLIIQKQGQITYSQQKLQNKDKGECMSNKAISIKQNNIEIGQENSQSNKNNKISHNNYQAVHNKKIIGSNRSQSNQFVSTRLQQRANQLQKFQPHLITNTNLLQKTADGTRKQYHKSIAIKQQNNKFSQNDMKNYFSINFYNKDQVLNPYEQLDIPNNQFQNDMKKQIRGESLSDYHCSPNILFNDVNSGYYQITDAFNKRNTQYRQNIFEKDNNQKLEYLSSNTTQNRTNGMFSAQSKAKNIQQSLVKSINNMPVSSNIIEENDLNKLNLLRNNQNQQFNKDQINQKIMRLNSSKSNIVGKNVYNIISPIKL